ncbi:S-layer homology domain-containing protein [Desulfoscipio gibsoniae]
MGTESFTDAAAVHDWARTAVEWANAEGLITGRTPTTLRYPAATPPVRRLL